MQKLKKTHNLPDIQELEEKTANIWLSLGTLKITSTGSENTYYVDEFGQRFFCKNYPKH